MGVKVAINGFGRIGRTLVRAMVQRSDLIELVAINSRAESATLAHLLRYDSVHGPFNQPVEAKPDQLIIAGKPVAITRITDDAAKLPWKELGVQVVLESTGKFKDREANAKHLQAGAQKVILGAPGKKIDGTFVMGVNHLDYDPKRHHIVSNASCTTNCLAPVIKVLQDRWKIQKGLMTTVHSYTMDQRLLDGSHKDLRRARAAALSMIPTTTGAARAVTEVIPELKGKLDGLAVRVPTPNVSLVDFVGILEHPAQREEINQAFREAAKGPLSGILTVSEEELVSIDFTSSPYSSIVDLPLTSVMDGNLVKVLSWYDNEMGFSHRMLDLVLHMAPFLC